MPTQAMSCQTDSVQSRVGITQTPKVEYNHEDCQTEAVLSIAQEIQVCIEAPKTEMGTDCPEELIKEWHSQVEQNIRDEIDRKQL